MFDLTKIKDTSFLQKLSNSELEVLAKEIRSFIIEKVSVHGGHLSGNLGIVDLVIALNKFFCHGEKFIFDVGHQMYTQKILTGRAKYFDTLREIDGLSGFSSPSESTNDIWEVGHSSTSLAALAGMLESGERIISIIGDGALTGGEVYESFEYLSNCHKNGLIIINDNSRSISKNIPFMDKLLSNTDSLKSILESFGFNYIGPINGHDYNQMFNAFDLSLSYSGITVLHIKTKKGLGYKYAEEDVDGKWHSISPFNIKTGETYSIENQIPYVGVAAKYLSDFYKKYPSLKVINPAMTYSSSMVSLQKELNGNYYDAGITEQFATSFSAALAKNNPYVFLSIYSSFLQRSYDQLHQDISLQNLHVVIGIDKAGITGEEGKTHQGIYDISYLRTIPNLTICAPKDLKEVYELLDYAFFKCRGPIAIHYPKTTVLKSDYPEIGSSNIDTSWQKLCQKKDPDLYLITYSSLVDYISECISDMNVEIINARFINPIDKNLLIELSKKDKPIIVYEEAIKDNALGSAIINFYNEEKISKNIIEFAYPCDYFASGKIEDIRKKYHMDKETIKDEIKKLL